MHESGRVIYQLHHLTQVYNGRTVLQIDRLDIYASEILALVGPSGAGKSTLLRQLNFLNRLHWLPGPLKYTFNGLWPPL